MAAAACSSCIALGRLVQPRRLMPAATAPEDTSTNSTPCSRKATICLTHTAIAERSRPRPSAVSSALPIFTTQLCAPVTLARLIYQPTPENDGSHPHYKNSAIKRRWKFCLIPDVDDFRAVVVFVIEEVVVLVDIINAAHTGFTQSTLIVQRLQTGTRLVFDALIQLGQFLGEDRVFGDALGAHFQVMHDVATDAFGAVAADGRNHIDRALPVETGDDIGLARLAPVLRHLVHPVQ